MKRAIILCNLGTPDQPTPNAVGRYLDEFLMDPRVIDLPWPLRALLVKGVIVPRRRFESAEAYSKVWTERGSPLLFHSEDLTSELKKSHSNLYLAMRYGRPSLREIFDKLAREGPDLIQIFPLYPQISRATTGSIEVHCIREAKRAGLSDRLEFLRPFFDQPDFIKAWTKLLQPKIEAQAFDQVLFSFHGLPQKYVRKYQDPYPEHCYKTAELLAVSLGLDEAQYRISFQSRLGRAAWLTPYTADSVVEMARNGVRSLLVASPSFVADCLETIEELGMQVRDLFLQNGGERFELAPSLNSSAVWIEAVNKILAAEDRFQRDPISS